MNRTYKILVIIAVLVMCAVVGVLVARGCEPQRPPIPPAPITAAPPITPTATPTATLTPVPPTATPTVTPVPPTETPVPTVTPTPTMASDTKGDEPTKPPEAGGIPGDDQLMNVVLAGLLALLSAVGGGLVSRSLDRIPIWRNWHPSDASYKAGATYALTFLVGVGLTWAVNYGIPTYWLFIPEGVQYLFVSIILFYSSQKVFELDKKAQAATQAKLDEVIPGVTAPF